MSEPNKKITLGVFFGGASSEHEISCLSAISVMENLDQTRYTVVPVGITRDGVWFFYSGKISALRDGSWVNDSSCLTPAVLSPSKKHHGLLLLDPETKTYDALHLDCIFPVMHGENSEDGRLQGLLALSGVPFIGCETRGSAITMDKAATKLILETYGIPQANWVLLYSGDFFEDKEKVLSFVERELPYPVFVKPANTGSSKGVSRAQNRAALADAIALAASFDEKILIEESVEGKEVEVALLERRNAAAKELLVSSVGEIRPDGDFYDYDAKYIKGTSVCEIPADIDEVAAEDVREFARRIFRALDCRSLSRADFFVKGSRIIFNEINSLPGFTSISMYPKLFEHDGISYPLLLDTLIDFAIAGEKA